MIEELTCKSSEESMKGKGKEKVGENKNQSSRVSSVNLRDPKKRNPAEQFIFQRRTPSIAEPSGLVESSSLYAELGLTDSETESMRKCLLR
ncbi:hypothetical protein Tco_0765599 [Tanacetum coccineum]